VTGLEFQGHNKDMQENKSSQSWFFLVIGISLLAIAYFWPRIFAKMKQPNVLATVISTKGTTEWISRQALANKVPQKSSLVKFNESLATGSDGEMVLRFKRGAEIRLLPSSFVTLIRKANSTLLTLRKGEIEIIKEGEGNSLLISQNGQDRPLREYESPTNQAELWIDPQSIDTVKSVEAAPIPIQTTLEGSPSALTSNYEPAKDRLSPVTEQQTKDFQAQIRTMISDRVGRQKNHLFRCYSILIQTKKSAQGKIDLHFTVNNSGKVEDPMIVKTDIQDQKFEKCLLQVIKRTDFKSFQGQKISTYLPLRFEKNLKVVE
jgi:hypothetical protein